MKKRKYRIKVAGDGSPVYFIQVRALWTWVTLKTFYDPWDPDYASLCAIELLDLLRE